MGKKIDTFLNVLAQNSDGRYSYVDEWGGVQVGCSDFVRQNLYEAGIITEAERNNRYNLWAIYNYKAVLQDTSRFTRLDPSTTPQNGDILFYAYGHVAVYYNGGLYEATPAYSHGYASNGYTGVGYFGYYHNCSGVPLSDIYRIVDDEIVVPQVPTFSEKKEAHFEMGTADYSNKNDGKGEKLVVTEVNNDNEVSCSLGFNLILKGNELVSDKEYVIYTTEKDIVEFDGLHINMDMGYEEVQKALKNAMK